MTRTFDRHGISIVEILVAIVFLAVGALAALGLQVSALRGSGTAESIQTLTRIAESELLFRRGVEKAGAELVDAEACRVLVPGGLTCAVVITPCELSAGAPSCGAVSVTDAVAFEVTVTTSGARGAAVSLTSLVANLATASGGSSATDPNDPPGGGQPGGGTGGGGVGGPPAGGDPPVACTPRGNSGVCN